jgi:hypothetical protein
MTVCRQVRIHLGYVETTVNHRYNGLIGVGDRVSVMAYVTYNRFKGYSRKYTIGSYKGFFILVLSLILNSFLTTKPY